jgi:hypothetical protein
MIDSKTFSDSNVIWDLAQFLCTTCEEDFDVLVEFYDIEREDKVLMLEYATFVKIVWLKSEESQNKSIVKWMNNFIFDMNNATNLRMVHGQMRLMPCSEQDAQS